MAEEISVILKRNENRSFGFSLLGEPGLPPIIYNILDDFPAAESGVVEVGDVILQINETDVIKFNTKEVLKCLRLSVDPVTLKIKRDPNIRSTILKHLLTSSDVEERDKIEVSCLQSLNILHPEPTIHRVHHIHQNYKSSNGSYTSEQESLLPMEKQQCQSIEDSDCMQWKPLDSNGQPTHVPPKFEAYMMTGQHMLNISRSPQTSTIKPKHQKQVDNLRYHNSHCHHLRHRFQQSIEQISMPNSPNEKELGSYRRAVAKLVTIPTTTPLVQINKKNLPVSDGFNYVRTSRSEDQLQDHNEMCCVSVANAEADEDIASSLNTLLDTRLDSLGCNNEIDRIIWTYNSPFTEHNKFIQTSNGSSSSHSNVSLTSSSSPHSESPASPTSISSSVMSNFSGSRRIPNGPSVNQEFNISEAISNISSPDYHDDDSVGIRDCIMEISDHSDSDSTLLVSEPKQRHIKMYSSLTSVDNDEHRIVIQVRGPDKERSENICDRKSSGCSSTIRNEVTEYQTHTRPVQFNNKENENIQECSKRFSQLSSSEDESDLESLYSFHYSPKAVDLPSAIRLAKRLYSLDGFKKSDVSRHLSKNNDFSKTVADEYLKYFDFERETLDVALRRFLKQFCLTGETQERERVLVHFSKRYLDCNRGTFNSQDAVHTLTCAIMLLNTDLHGQNIGRKMTCSEFIENLVGLNETENFPKDVLKQLYHAIRSFPLEWAVDGENEEANSNLQLKTSDIINVEGNPFLEISSLANTIEYKKGYVMRKCCYEANAKRTPFHKRRWKMFYCTLKGPVLYLHKDENGFRMNQISDNLHNAIRIHHALATKASDYTKKQFVFRIQTADQAEYLFQTSDSKDLQSWIDTINFVCASFSAPPLEAAVGSQRRFQRPLLPCSHTKLNFRDQLSEHEERVMRLEAVLDEHRKSPPNKSSKAQVSQNYKDKENYLNFELKRYKTYSYMLRTRLCQYAELNINFMENTIGEMDEASGCGIISTMDEVMGIVSPPNLERPSPTINRYSYRQAIYNCNTLNEECDIG